MPSIEGPEDFSLTLAKRVQAILQAAPELAEQDTHFGMIHEITDDDMPCLDIELGDDTPFVDTGQSMSNRTDSLQVLFVDIYEGLADSEALVRVTHRRAIIHALLMGDYTLGLPFVIQARYGGSLAPEGDDETGPPSWMMRTVWPVHYRFNEDDRSVFTG